MDKNEQLVIKYDGKIKKVRFSRYFGFSDDPYGDKGCVFVDEDNSEDWIDFRDFVVIEGDDLTLADTRDYSEN